MTRRPSDALGLDPSEHGDVDDDDIAAQTPSSSDHLATVIGLAHYLQVDMRGQDRSQARPDQSLVVAHHYTDAHWPPPLSRGPDRVDRLTTALTAAEEGSAALPTRD